MTTIIFWVLLSIYIVVAWWMAIKTHPDSDFGNILGVWDRAFLVFCWPLFFLWAAWVEWCDY